MSQKLTEPKICCKCGELKPRSEYPKQGGRCNKCRYIRHKEHDYYVGNHIPMNENKSCSIWLGVHIAEQMLSNYFDDIKIMPYGNKGFDYICNKGYKIDVKSGCLIQPNGYWTFHINKNSIPDYFLCIGFNNRINTIPLKLWLIPSHVVSNKMNLCITNSTNSIQKWIQYEKPIDKLL